MDTSGAKISEFKQEKLKTETKMSEMQQFPEGRRIHRKGPQAPTCSKKKVDGQ